MEIAKLYKKECANCLQVIKVTVTKIKNKKGNKQTFANLRRAAHTLKSSSLQMQYYSMGYLAQQLEDIARLLAEKKIKPTKKIVAFLHDFSTTIGKVEKAIQSKKTPQIKPELIKNLDSILGKAQEKGFTKVKKLKETDDLEKIYKEETKKAINMLLTDIERVKRESDLDLFIETTNKDLKKEIERIDAKINLKIGKYNKENLVIKEIEKNHIILKGVDIFYEKNKFFD